MDPMRLDLRPSSTGSCPRSGIPSPTSPRCWPIEIRAFDLIVGEPSAWTSSRLPDPARLAAAYEAAGGVPLVDLDLHLALAHYKIAVIAAGIAHRHCAGSGSGAGFETAGTAVAPFLEAARSALRSGSSL